MDRATTSLEVSWVTSVFALLKSILVGSAAGHQKGRVTSQARTLPSCPLLSSHKASGTELIPNHVHVGGAMPERALKCGCRSLGGTVPRVDMETLPSSPHSLLCVFTYILCDTFQSKLRNVSKYFPGFCKLF